MPYFLTLLAINLAVITIAFYKHKYAPASKRFYIGEDNTTVAGNIGKISGTEIRKRSDMVV